MDIWMNEISNVFLYGLFPVYIAFLIYAIDFVKGIRG